MPAGRPSLYTPELAERICEMMAAGKSLPDICENDGMPHPASIYRWLRSEPEFCELYAQARERQADKYFDEITSIADDSRNDTQVDEDGNIIVNHDYINRARLRVDARKWVAARLAPKKYGDRQEVVGANGTALIPDQTAPARDIAKAIMAILADAVRPQIEATAEDAETVDDPREGG